MLQGTIKTQKLTIDKSLSSAKMPLTFAALTLGPFEAPQQIGLTQACLNAKTLSDV